MQLTARPLSWPAAPRGTSEFPATVRMTPRKVEVLDLLALGFTNGAIAERLGISFDGAKWHVGEVLTALGFDNRHEAGHWWQHVLGAHS